MRYNLLGTTGLLVSELCLGTMQFGGGTEGLGGAIGNLQQDEANTLLRAAFDAGINFFDTADVYGGGRSEEITGQAIKDIGLKRSDFVLSTKFIGKMGEGPNQRGASRYHIMEAVKASLSRLQLDHIDVYHVHAFDPLTPMEETLRAMNRLVQDGVVRYFGVSNWAAWQVARGLGVTERLGLERIQCLQGYYSLMGRDLEREMIPMLLAEKVGLLIWSPLAGGFLSGKYDRNDPEHKAGRLAKLDFPPMDKTRGWDIIDAIRPIAEAKGATVAQVALAWLLHKPVVTSAIIGVKNLRQLEDNLGSTKVALSDADMETLDAVSALVPEYTEWMEMMSDGQEWYPENQPARGE